ncbi:MAG: hypothetical protein AB7I36_16750 [Rhodospirillaceae bacterium]
MTSDKARIIVYRAREQELIDLAATMSGPTRDDLLRVSLVWKRLADQAEQEQAQPESPRE